MVDNKFTNLTLSAGDPTLPRLILLNLQFVYHNLLVSMYGFYSKDPSTFSLSLSMMIFSNLMGALFSLRRTIGGHHVVAYIVNDGKHTRFE